MRLSDDISSIRGIGEKSAALFHKVGIFSLKDLITYYPASYITYPPISRACGVSPDHKAALLLKVMDEPKVVHIRGRVMLSFNAGDDNL